MGMASWCWPHRSSPIAHNWRRGSLRLLHSDHASPHHPQTPAVAPGHRLRTGRNTLLYIWYIRKEATNMAKVKQHVFSARTTEEGLKVLNGLRKERGIGWDDLVVDAATPTTGWTGLSWRCSRSTSPRRNPKERRREANMQRAPSQPKRKQSQPRAPRPACSIFLAPRQGFEP